MTSFVIGLLAATALGLGPIALEAWLARRWRRTRGGWSEPS